MAVAKRIICVGHAALDRIYRIEAFPPEPTKVRALEHVEAGGGMAANAAAAIAKLGGKAELWSRTGDDAAGSAIRAGLKADKVDVRYVQAFDGARSSTSAIIVDGKGERLIVGQRDAGMPSGTSWLPLERIKEADAVLGDVRWLEGLRTVFTRARKEKVPTILDADLGAREALGGILALTDYAIFCAPALREFVHDGSNAERLEQVLSLGPRHAGVTLGREGYLWRERGGGGHVPAFKVTADRYDRRRRCLSRRLRADAGGGPPDCRMRARCCRGRRHQMYATGIARGLANAGRDRQLPVKQPASLTSARIDLKQYPSLSAKEVGSTSPKSRGRRVVASSMPLRSAARVSGESERLRTAGKILLMTGGTSGIGRRVLERTLIEQPHWTIILLARPSLRVDELKALPGASERLIVVEADLASLQSVASACDRVARLIGSRAIDAMALNAGIQTVSADATSADGLELAFAVNFLAHFLIVERLKKLLQPGGRIIITSSEVHDPDAFCLMGIGRATWQDPIVLADPVRSQDHVASVVDRGEARYCASKLLVLMYVRHLALKLPEIGVVAFNPSVVPGTEIGRDRNWLQQLGWKYVMPALAPILPGARALEQSASDLLWLLTEADAQSLSGQYVDGRLSQPGSKELRDRVKIGRAVEVANALVERCLRSAGCFRCDTV